MPKRVEIKMILDESGSMAGEQHDVIKGFNEFLDSRKEETGIDYTISLIKFANSASAEYIGVPVEKAMPLCVEVYSPSGSTALLDALGGAIESTIENDRTSYLVVVMTDGKENCSRRYSLDRVRELITEKEEKGNWTFTFLGKDIDSWGEASSMGMVMGNTADARTMAEAFDLTNNATRAYAARGMTGMSTTFSTSEFYTVSAGTTDASED